MKLLISESPLQLIPSLAIKVGLNEAIILQQLHYRALISTNERDGHKWVYKTYEEWKFEEFPFWSVDTIKRAIRRLEDDGYIVSTNTYNRMKMDKTKWYRIDYSLLHLEEPQPTVISEAKSTQEEEQFAPSTRSNLHLAITKEIKSNKKEIVEKRLDVVQIIAHLNAKSNKQYRASSKATERLVKSRLREGYTLDDFKNVIDCKANDWVNDPQWHRYLRPSTLFSATNFENYLQESKTDRSEHTSVNTVVNSQPKPFELNFSEGED